MWADYSGGLFGPDYITSDADLNPFWLTLSYPIISSLPEIGKKLYCSTKDERHWSHFNASWKGRFPSPPGLCNWTAF